ncbi:MAG: hypothetical protein JWP87_2850 [Labilithrix sp.]|nr:hypothetical protein [Labilithrix sp.]
MGTGVSLSIAGVLLACGAGRLPAPAYTGQPTDALQQVDFPPPPARVEFVPPEPEESAAVWIDGEWTWQGGRYAWKPGRWLAPPTGAKFSPWTWQRDKLGDYYVAEGKWRDAQGRELPDPKPIAVGRTRGGSVTGPEGEAVPPTPNVPAATPPDSESKDKDGGAPQTPSGSTPTGTEPKTGPIGADAGAASEGSVRDASAGDER